MSFPLFQHSIAPDNLVRHTWSPGDIVMSDNRCVLHRADHSSVDGDRIMRRRISASPVV
ncbi:MAG: taurine dioxygenase [Actinomycetes bacterium]|jgi:taurine dioxygenase